MCKINIFFTPMFTWQNNVQSYPIFNKYSSVNFTMIDISYKLQQHTKDLSQWQRLRSFFSPTVGTSLIAKKNLYCLNFSLFLHETNIITKGDLNSFNTHTWPRAHNSTDYLLSCMKNMSIMCTKIH